VAGIIAETLRLRCAPATQSETTLFHDVSMYGLIWTNVCSIPSGW
jgi:hypothetical protein